MQVLGQSPEPLPKQALEAYRGGSWAKAGSYQEGQPLLCPHHLLSQIPVSAVGRFEGPTLV